MKITHAAILSTCSLLLAGVNARLGTRMTGRAGIIDPSVDEFVPDDEYVISFNDPDDGDTFRSMSQTFTRVSGRIEVHSILKNLNMATARVKPEALDELRNDPRVRSIEFNMLFHWDETARRKVMENPVSSVRMAMGNQPIPPFMKDVSGCNDPSIVKIAVIDGGIDARHPDFMYCADGYCEGKRFMSPPEQDWGLSTNDHGTHVAGIVAASALNGGYANGMVSDNKLCLMVGRVFNDDGGGATLSAVVDALDWAIERGAHIVNMSFGISADLGALHDAIKRLRAAGVLAIASAGNAGQEVKNYPAYYEETLAVGAVDESKKWADFSTFNDRVDISAPGVNVRSTLPGKRDGLMDGTSMSAPFVAGTAALMKRDCMLCSDNDIWSCLIDTAESIDCTVQKCGAGFLQAGAAYQCLRDSPCCASLTSETFKQKEPENQCGEAKERCITGDQCCSGRCNRRGRCTRDRRKNGRFLEDTFDLM